MISRIHNLETGIFSIEELAGIAVRVWDGYQSYQMGSYESDRENREDEHVLS